MLEIIGWIVIGLIAIDLVTSLIPRKGAYVRPMMWGVTFDKAGQETIDPVSETLVSRCLRNVMIHAVFKVVVIVQLVYLIMRGG